MQVAEHPDPAGPGRAFVLDAHQHLWDPGLDRHPWLDEDPTLAPLRRRFDLRDYREAAAGGVSGLPVGRTVLVQSLASSVETTALLRLAQTDELVGAVVGWLDLEGPDVAEHLGSLRTGPGGDRLRGIRHLVQGETDPAWLTRPSVLRGLRHIADAGLGYDVLVRPHQLRSAIALADQLPGLALVLDHAGKPDLTGPGPARTAALAPWAADVRRLAAHPQVTCKVSGLVTEADWAGWTVDDLTPVFEVLLQTFGPHRLMFGSDWPVCLLATSWKRWAETVERLIDPLTAGERADILGGTAALVYAGPGMTPPPATALMTIDSVAGRR